MGDWADCSVPCGGGTQTRNFIVTTPAANGGTCDADGSSESQACNTDACPVDCVGEYGDLSDCSEPCGPTGVATRSFIITTPASDGGQECSVAAGNVETQSCNTEIACPVDCVGSMGDWADCSVPCGGGTQTRNFIVTTPAANGGTCDSDGSSESQACNTDACPPPPPEPVDCVGSYSALGECSEPCVTGASARCHVEEAFRHAASSSPHRRPTAVPVRLTAQARRKHATLMLALHHLLNQSTVSDHTVHSASALSHADLPVSRLEASLSPHPPATAV